MLFIIFEAFLNFHNKIIFKFLNPYKIVHNKFNLSLDLVEFA